MADFQLKVTAETQAAERKLQQVDKLADKATKARKLSIDLRSLNKSFSSLQTDIKAAANNVRTFYSVSKGIPGVGNKVKEFEDLAKSTAATAKQQFQFGTALKESAQAGKILTGSLNLAGTAGSRLIDTLAKIGFATFALKEAVGIVQAAWNGFFNTTIGREIQLRETILKTQTTLASTNKVLADGREITDPYQKIVALTGAVADRIDSIRERSIALAGVTSNEVIEVFGIVASQVGQIGGGLKEAEDLAINFAAALGTFGIPLYQAQQEIGSILRGDITMDSYLAKALGITNDDIARAKTQVGGVVKFLEDRLSAAVAGQKIASEGFAGVVSNIADLGELIGQNFGRGLLDPLIAGLTSVFETLFRIRQQLFDIASGAGRAIGTAGRLVVGLTAGRTGLGSGNPEAVARSAAAVAERGFQQIQQVAQRTVGAITQAVEALKPTALILVDAFKNIAEAFVRIKVGSFEALASALANIASVVGAIAQPLATVFNLYSRFLNTPAVRYFSEVAAVLGLLKRVGLDAVTQLVLFGRFIFGSIIPAIGGLGTALGGLVGAIAAVVLAVGKLIVVFAGLATALVGPAAAIPALAAGLKALSVELLSVGKQAVTSGTQLNGLAAGFRGLGAGAKAAGASILASLGWLAVIQIGIAALVDAFGRYQRAQEDQRSSARAAEALRRLQTTYKDVGDSADSATKAARDFELAIVNAEYDRALRRLDEIKEKLKELRKDAEEFNPVQDFLKLFDVTRTFRGAIGQSDLNQRRRLVKEEADLRKQLRAVDATRDREQAERNIQLEAQNRVNLEKEISELRRQLDNDLFQQRQALAQKEVEIFRAAGELRIFQMEQANAKLIEGEEGASAAALESLNNYLSVRERGELDIEAAKKSLVVEVANLEREIANYRLENEKKIAEIRKRAGDYDKAVADHRRQAAGATGPAITDGFRVGNTGRSTGPHLDIRNPAGDGRKVIDEAVQIIKAWQAMGVAYIQLSNTRKDVKNITLESDLRRALAEEQRVHGRRSGGGAIDIAVPEGTIVPRRTGTPSWDSGGGGWMATSLDTGNIFLHGQNASKASVTAGQTPLVEPTAPSFDDIGAPAVEKYAQAVRGVASAMERARALQEALTNARTIAAFEEIARAAFPKVALEDYDNQAIELTGTLDALRGISAELYDPEQIRIAVEQESKRLIAERERSQILKEANRRRAEGKLTQSELDRLTKQLDERQKKYVKDLDAEAKARRRNLELTKQQAAVESLKRATGAIRFDLQRAGAQAQATMAQAYAGDNAAALRRIEAEQRITDERIRLEQDATKTTEDVTRELTAFAEKTRAAALDLGAMDEQVQQFVTQMAAIREVSRTLVDSYKGLAQNFLSGGDLKDAVGQMTRSIADKLIGMTLEAAFKPMEELFVQTLKDVFAKDDPMQLLQEQNNANLDLNTQAIQANTLALQRASTSPVPGGESEYDTMARLASRGPDWQAAIEQELTQSFAGIGESLTQLGTVAEATGKQTDKAGTDGKKGFGKFLGAMTGVATGALAITGAIQAMQQSESGTYGTLMGIAGILGGLGSIAGGFAALGKRAGGGPVSARRPYVVGEVGPELFVPDSPGTIVPANRLAAGPFAASAGYLDQAAPAPRALRNDPIKVDTRVINGVEYATAQQLREATAQAERRGAERGQALALASMRNNVRTRKQLGI